MNHFLEASFLVNFYPISIFSTKISDKNTLHNATFSGINTRFKVIKLIANAIIKNRNVY